jgi:hypothetical protein
MKFSNFTGKKQVFTEGILPQMCKAPSAATAKKYSIHIQQIQNPL